MPKRFQRSSRYKRVKVRVPSGEVRERFVRREAKDKGRCAVCGQPLRGVSSKGAKSEKKPSRKFAGTLCHRCTAVVIRYAVRLKEGSMALEDVPLKYVPYLPKI